MKISSAIRKSSLSLLPVVFLAGPPAAFADTVVTAHAYAAAGPSVETPADARQKTYVWDAYPIKDEQDQITSEVRDFKLILIEDKTKAGKPVNRFVIKFNRTPVKNAASSTQLWIEIADRTGAAVARIPISPFIYRCGDDKSKGEQAAEGSFLDLDFDAFETASLQAVHTARAKTTCISRKRK